MKTIIYKNKFQYQKGAIKTAACNPAAIATNAFQYQKGAIKTIVEQSNPSTNKLSFNTKKVRLKL